MWKCSWEKNRSLYPCHLFQYIIAMHCHSSMLPNILKMHRRVCFYELSLWVWPSQLASGKKMHKAILKNKWLHNKQMTSVCICNKKYIIIQKIKIKEYFCSHLLISLSLGSTLLPLYLHIPLSPWFFFSMHWLGPKSDFLTLFMYKTRQYTTSFSQTP